MATVVEIRKRIAEIDERIASAAELAGRSPDSIDLIAVSKTYPPEVIAVAYEAGHRHFGENRVQELETKVGGLPEDIEWHLIGHLQSNKALKAINSAAYIHAVDSSKLIQRLNRLAGENQVIPKILLEFNVSGEESKFGITEQDAALELGETAAAAANLDFVGLMTMAPYGAESDELRQIFAGLRNLRDKIEQETGKKLPELSMGMSADFEEAILEGATMVRIGTAIFGAR